MSGRSGRRWGGGKGMGWRQDWEESRLEGQTPKPKIPAGSLTGGSLLSLERVKKMDQIAGKNI